MASPTSRSLAVLRKDGWTVAVVEKWNQNVKVRKDLFGVIDLVAIKPGESGVLGIQSTSKSNMSARYNKACAEPRLRTWLGCGNRYLIHGWECRKVPFCQTRHVLKVREVTVSDFPAQPAPAVTEPGVDPARAGQR